ncbi:septum formation family protein [Promicromonospora sp. Populi]|uniref:septum formation family protein n=1 Tax=Promicromonospora sp. Populi TaxID=3239420 RepID=UPI0034E24950
MTSKPDQSPANEVAGASAADPVEKASAVKSEQNTADTVVGDTDGGPEISGQADDAADAGEPAAPVIESVPSAEALTEDPAAEDASVGDDGPQAAAGADGVDAPVPSAASEPKADEVKVADEATATDKVQAANGVPAGAAAPAAETAAGAATKAAAPKPRSRSPKPAPKSAPEAAKPVAAKSGAADPAAPAADTPVARTEAPDEAADIEPVEATPGLPRRPKRYEAPTEEIRIVAPARSKPAAPSPAAPAPAAPAPAPAPTSDTTPAEPASPPEPTEAEADSADNGTPKSSSSKKAPVVDESFDFKALSFAAISAAHKKALGPRTVAGEAAAGQKTEDATDAQNRAAERVSEPLTEEEAAAHAKAEAARAAKAEAELFAPPATHIPPVAEPPSPFPTPTAPPQHHAGIPVQNPPAAPPPSPFPVSRGTSAQTFPAVNDYAPETSYAGWRPPTPADEAAKRRRFTLITGAVLAVVALVAVIAVVVNVVNRQQWEPIPTMIAEPQEVHPLQLVLGSCVESVPDDGEVSEVLAVPCDASHTAQVVGRTDFAEAAVWPGRDAVDSRIAQVCGTQQLGPTARTSPVAGSVSYVVWGPSEASWADGDRVGLCLATTDEAITQDLLQ